MESEHSHQALVEEVAHEDDESLGVLATKGTVDMAQATQLRVHHESHVMEC